MPAFIRPLTLPFTVLDSPYPVVDIHPYDGDDMEHMADNLYREFRRPRYNRDGSTYFMTVADFANEYVRQAVECVEYPEPDWTAADIQVWHDCLMCRANYMLAILSL